MPATFQSAGAVAYSASGGTSVAPAYPSGINNDDGLVMIVGQKPSTANSGSVTTPSGWTLLGSNTAQGGYSTTLGADVGNTNLLCYIRIADGTETGSVTVTVGTNNVCWAQILRLTHDAGESWLDATVVTGSDSSAGSVSVVGGSVSFTVPDLCLWAFCMPTDVNTGAEFSAHQVSASGIGFSAATEISEPSSGTGNDIGGFLARAAVTSGSGTVAPTFAAVAASGTNARGPGLLLRVHVQPADVSASATLAAAAALTSAGVGQASGSATLSAAASLTSAATGTSPAAATLSASASLTATAKSAPPILFVGDYETGDYSQWEVVQNVFYNDPGSGYDGSGTFYSAYLVPGFQGTYASRFQVDDGDIPFSNTERSEAQGPLYDSGAEPGDERWYQWSTKFDPTFPSNHAAFAWGLVNQFHDESGGSPPVGMYVDGPPGEWGLRVNVQSSPGVFVSSDMIWSASLDNGVWHTIKLHVIWSTSSTVGLVELWYDGAKQTFTDGPGTGTQTTSIQTLTPTGGGVYYKQGYYREGSTGVGTGIVTHDGYVAASAEEALPVIVSGSATLAASAVFTSAATGIAPGAVSLGASAALTATGSQTAHGAVALDAAAALSASGVGLSSGSAALDASAALVAGAVATTAGAADLSAAAELAAAADVTVPAAADLAASAELSASAGVTTLGSAALVASAALSAEAVGVSSGTVALDATADLTAATGATAPGAAELAAGAGLTASAPAESSAAADLPASAALSADAVDIAPGDALLAASAAVTAGAVGEAPGAASLDAAATLTAAETGQAQGSADLAASAALVAGALATVHAAAQLAAGSDLAAQAAGITAGLAVLTAGADFTASGDGLTGGSADLDAGASLLATAQLVVSAQVVLAAAASLVATGSTEESGSVVLAATAALVASAVVTSGIAWPPRAGSFTVRRVATGDMSIRRTAAGQMSVRRTAHGAVSVR